MWSLLRCQINGFIRSFAQQKTQNITKFVTMWSICAVMLLGMAACCVCKFIKIE